MIQSLSGPPFSCTYSRKVLQLSISLIKKCGAQEQLARQAVVLPYEHQGAGQAYKTGDFKDYLPQAAGGSGRGAGEGSLGHILYVRDSASEHDSDEDPDDDLDI